MKFQPAVSFPVFIDGKPATALVLEKSDHPVQIIFQVAFSNGFMDEFMLEDDGNVYGSGIAAIPYAKAIRFDIGYLAILDPGRFYYNFPETIDGLKTNVWVIEGDAENGEPVYKVYYFEFFRFALQRQQEHWRLFQPSREGKTPDGRLVEKISYLLDSLLKESR